MTIKLTFKTIDGLRKTKSYTTLAGARNAAQNWVGKNADLGSTYAVSFDGVVTLSCEGCALADLFGDEPTPAVRKGFVAKLHCGGYDLYNDGYLFGHVRIGGAHYADDELSFEGYGDEELTHIVSSLSFDGKPTLKTYLHAIREAYEYLRKQQAAEARAEQDAENAWLRHAEQGSLESQHEEEIERQREAAGY